MNLTPQQKKVLEYIKEHILKEGYPPTVREVAGRFGYRSPLSAKLHIDALVKKGFLRKTPYRSRGLEVVGLNPYEALQIPVAGSIRAGVPIFATENIEEYISVDRQMLRTEDGFGLRVVGESMKGAGILEGDIVIINPEVEARRGDIVVALIGDDATVKRFYPEGKKIRLQPENP
ncbi:MAG TPA: transcriptional repressor LexA, partial [Nitrospirae bacterium]|nr:transcriptional repressor LexA [Nitrospirota bacterium]